MFFRRKNYKKNLSTFMQYVDEIVNEADEKFSTPPCMPYIKGPLDMVISKSKDQIERWTDETDIDRIAHTAVYNVAFDVLSSGQLHIYRGMLDDSKPGDKLMFIVEKCLLYAVKKGTITELQHQEQLEILRENINDVG